MRLLRFLALAALALPSGLLLAQQVPTFKTRADVVVLYTTVTDSSGRLVPNLVQSDFEVLDDSRPQPIAVFQNDVEPITVVVMLDTSASMTPSLDLLQAGAEQFLLRLLPDDRAKVGAFNDKIEVYPVDFTSDRDELAGILKHLDFGNPTRLYDAIDLSLDQLQPVAGRRVVLVFTDGADTDSRAGLGTVLNRARAEEVMMYAIGLESDYFNGVRRVRSSPDRGLRRLAEETGGGYFELKRTAELGATFTRVAQELHSQYVIGFEPKQLDGKVHSLTVRVKQPGMTARARKSYVASDRPAGTGS